MEPLLVDMTLEHLGEVSKIESVVFTNPWKKSDFEFALKRDNSFCKVVLVDDTLVGYVVGFMVDQEFHLADVAISPPYQQQSLGRRTLEIVFDMLEDRAQVVSLEVRMSNQVAIDLYKKMGFETMAIRKDYYTGPREDALMMLKPLKSHLSDWVSRVLPDALRKHNRL